MLKELGAKPYLFPMPVMLVATYDSERKVNAMVVAWGGICGDDLVMLNLDLKRKTLENIKLNRAFTIALADRAHMAEADYLGSVSGLVDDDKFQKTNLNSSPSDRVAAPVLTDFPLTLECELVEIQNGPNDVRIIGRILNVLADEKVLDPSGKVEPSKLDAILFEPYKRGYYSLGERVGDAWKEGKKLGI